MSKLSLTARPLNLKLRYPFGLSRGISILARNVLITLKFDETEGYGEAAPTIFYGEDQKSALEFIESFAKNRSLDKYLTNISNLKEDLDNFNLSIGRSLKSNLFSYSARVGIEIAFWDLIGKINKKPLFECLFSSNPFASRKNNGGLPPTSYTIAIDDLSVIKGKTQEAVNKGFNILKIKLGLGYEKDIEILKTVSECKNGNDFKLRVDANCGWDIETTKKMLDVLPEYNVELLEQPLPKGQSHLLSKLNGKSPIPIIVDEDCAKLSDIESLAGLVDGVNIKLMKTGSLFEALDMINLAKSYNLKIMIGCMIESSCSISAAVHLSPLADYIDLDGHLLIDNDPFTGLILEKNRVLPSFGDGLGIALKEL